MKPGHCANNNALVHNCNFHKNNIQHDEHNNQGIWHE